MAPPTIVTPAPILTFFIISLLKNSASSEGVLVGGEESEGGDPSSPSGIGCENADPSGPSGIGCEDADSSDAEKYCEDSDPSDADDNGVGTVTSEFQSVDDDRWYQSSPNPPLTLNLKEVVASPVPALPTTQALEERAAEMMVVSGPVPTRGSTTVEVTRMTLDLKGEAHATTLDSEGPDYAAAPPTTMTIRGSMVARLVRRRRMLRRCRGWLRRCWPIRWCLRILCYDRLIGARSMHLLRYYRSSKDEVENGKDERDLSKYPIRVHLWDV
ncbi:hypothetical protein F5888DRAFT_1636737 [Russula emetica]|nr:hypothetical protein F5888DRAFT_1636737 [Russula emetica]